MTAYQPPHVERRARANREQVAERPIPIGRRGAARLRLSIPAKVVTLSDTRHCILIDLSRTGAQIGIETPLRKGENVFLQIEGLDEFAEVVRVDFGRNGGINGIIFEEPLTDEQVVAVRHYSECMEAKLAEEFRDQVRVWVSGE